MIADDPDGDRRHSLFIDPTHAGDSGIDSIQASPSPNAFICLPGGVGMVGGGGGGCGSSGSTSIPGTSSVIVTTSPSGSPTPSLSKPRRPSSALLHPDHARLLALRTQQQSPDQTSLEDMTEFNGGACGIQIGTTSSSTTSSLTSIAAASINPHSRYFI